MASQVMTTELNSPQAMRSFASSLGQNLKGGELIELSSDLGGGKTTFVKGLVVGAGSQDLVSSPSFTIRNDYLGSKFDIAHFDFYRLNEAGIIKDMLTEVLNDPAYVTVIEWGGLVQDVLPDKHIKLDIQISGEDARRVTIDCPEQFSYVLKGVKAA